MASAAAHWHQRRLARLNVGSNRLELMLMALVSFGRLWAGPTVGLVRMNTVQTGLGSDCFTVQIRLVIEFDNLNPELNECGFGTLNLHPPLFLLTPDRTRVLYLAGSGGSSLAATNDSN